MRTVTAGPALIELVALAYRAGVALMLVGRHGVGKSEILAEAARRLGIDLIVRDLSLMEPLDLSGLPKVGQDRRTHHMPPAFLPRKGVGLLVFEEVNRAPRYVVAPLFELLTYRRLNDYRLPDGWLPCVALNEAKDGYYLVERLDDALIGRFLRIRVAAGVDEWIAWARNGGRVDETIVDFVDSNPDVFDDPVANPRSWTLASDALRAWEASGTEDPGTLLTLVSGLVDDKWGNAFVEFYRTDRRPLKLEDIVVAYPDHRELLRQYITDGRLDLVRASLSRLQRRLRNQAHREKIIGDSRSKANAERFLSDLPTEMKTQVREWIDEQGVTGLSVPRKVRS